jgi:hypothetical protein
LAEFLGLLAEFDHPSELVMLQGQELDLVLELEQKRGLLLELH